MQKLNEVVETLADKLDLNIDEVNKFIRKTLKYIDNLNLIVSYLIEEGKEGVMYKVE